MSELFRAQAVAEHATRRSGSALIDLTPGWTRWSFWLLLAVVGGTIAWACVGTIHEYAVGPAIVRVDGRTDLTARFAATVAAVLVAPGQRVAAGQPLVRFNDDDEAAERDRLREEFELQLLKLLRDPQDQSARQALSTLRAQQELATSRLEQRVVRAPLDGIVSDLRIRAGQRLAAGELLLRVDRADASLSLVALLPGRYRPMLQRGMPLRFELSGYRYEYCDVRIDSVADEIIGPAEAKRFLGPDVADSIDLREPVVLVRAAMPSRHFTSDGERFDYYDGLHGEAQARVRSQPLLLRALPALRELGHHGS